MCVVNQMCHFEKMCLIISKGPSGRMGALEAWKSKTNSEGARKGGGGVTLVSLCAFISQVAKIVLPHPSFFHPCRQTDQSEKHVALYIEMAFSKREQNLQET